MFASTHTLRHAAETRSRAINATTLLLVVTLVLSASPSITSARSTRTGHLPQRSTQDATPPVIDGQQERSTHSQRRGQSGARHTPGAAGRSSHAADSGTVWTLTRISSSQADSPRDPSATSVTRGNARGLTDRVCTPGFGALRIESLTLPPPIPA